MCKLRWILVFVVLILLAGCGRKPKMSKDHAYTFTVKHQMTRQEVTDLRKQHYPKLENFSHLYAPQLDIKSGFPARPEYFDVIRTKWLLDTSNEKPSFQYLQDAVGLGFGMLLEQTLDMKWCIIVDNFGESISMVHFGNNTDTCEKISFPQYSYIQKRENVMNAEVFSDAYRQLEHIITKNDSEQIDP